MNGGCEGGGSISNFSTDNKHKFACHIQYHAFVSFIRSFQVCCTCSVRYFVYCLHLCVLK